MRRTASTAIWTVRGVALRDVAARDVGPNLIGSAGSRALGRGELSIKGRRGTYGTLWIEASQDVSRKVGEVVFVNRYGRGTAVYCNFLLTEYRDQISRGTAGQVYAVFADLIRNLASVRPRVEALKGEDLFPDLHVVCYRSGRTLLAAAQRHTYSYRFPRLTEEKSDTVTVRFPSAGNVYEVWTERFLGTGREIQDVLEPGARRVYVVLPYRTTGLKLSATDAVSQGAELAVGAEILKDGSAKRQPHVFRLTVTRPDGTTAEWFSQSVVAPGGRAEAVLPIAVDAPVGKWQVKVRDILTGVSATEAFEVRRGQ